MIYPWEYVKEKEIWDIINSPNFAFAKETRYSYKCTIGQSGVYMHMDYAYGKTLFEAATHLVENIKGEKYVPITDNGNNNERLDLLKETVIWECIRSCKTTWVSKKPGKYEILCYVNEDEKKIIIGMGETMFDAAKDLYKKIHEEDNV